MATTTNLSLQKINGSDFVSPNVFNQNFDRIDQLGVDYVVETGRSGIWRYQRWKSGKCECWGNYTTPVADYNEPWYSTWYPGYSFTLPNFPKVFSEAPTVVMNVARFIRNETWGYTGIWDVFTTAVNTKNCGCLVSSDKKELQVSVVIGVYVVGSVNS